MIRRLCAIAAVSLAAALPAAAQSSAPMPVDGRLVQVRGATPIEAQDRTNLPGVNLDLSSSNRDASPRGPGGLQNGVGAYGVMAPDASGTAGNTLTRIPGAIPDTNNGVGIPISQQGEPAN